MYKCSVSIFSFFKISEMLYLFCRFGIYEFLYRKIQYCRHNRKMPVIMNKRFAFCNTVCGKSKRKRVFFLFWKDVIQNNFDIRQQKNRKHKTISGYFVRQVFLKLLADTFRIIFGKSEAQFSAGYIFYILCMAACGLPAYPL